MPSYARPSVFERIRSDGDREHRTAIRQVVAVEQRGSGMEYFDAGNRCRLIEAGNTLPRCVTSRISLRRRDNTGRSAWLPTKRGFAQTAFDTRFHPFEQVAFKAHQNRLRL